MLGPVELTAMTPRVSVGTVMQELSTVRVFAASGREVGAGVVDGRVAEVGVLVAHRGDRRHAVVAGVVDRPLGGLRIDALLGLLGRASRPGCRVQLKSHGSVKKLMLTTSTPMSPAYVERVDRRLEEEVAGVLAGPDVDQRDVRRDAGDAEAVDRRGDRAGDVGAVAVVVHVGRVDAARRPRRGRRSPGCR